jgi:hypothetical protein
LLITTVAFASAFLNRLRSETGPAQPPSPGVVRFTVPDVMPFAELPNAPALALSPDGTQLVYANRDGQLHVRALNRLQTRPLPGTNGASGPFFSPDGQCVGFVSGSKLKKVPLEGGAPATLCTVGPISRGASWLPDDTIRFDESHARLSSDGRFIAYVSDESGRNEVYAQPYPGPGGRVQVSTDGGDQPVWAPDDRELFYRKQANMMVAPVETHPTLQIGTSTFLFDAAPHLWGTVWGTGASYDVSPRDRRFIMRKARERQCRVGFVRG